MLTVSVNDMPANQTICLMLEFNCYEPPRPGVESPSLVWLVPYSLAADVHDFEHHKPMATRIVGPTSKAVAEQVNASLAAALRGLGFTVEEETTADD
jgi:hypothetical protein